jgi:hypothetical protein
MIFWVYCCVVGIELLCSEVAASASHGDASAEAVRVNTLHFSAFSETGWRHARWRGRWRHFEPPQRGHNRAGVRNLVKTSMRPAVRSSSKYHDSVIEQSMTRLTDALR